MPKIDQLNQQPISRKLLTNKKWPNLEVLEQYQKTNANTKVIFCWICLMYFYVQSIKISFDIRFHLRFWHLSPSLYWKALFSRLSRLLVYSRLFPDSQKMNKFHDFSMTDFSKCWIPWLFQTFQIPWLSSIATLFYQLNDNFV